MASLFFLDASALVKRYIAEVGSPVMHHLYARAANDRFVVLNVGELEGYSLLVRRRNAGALSSAVFSIATSQFETEIAKNVAVAKTAPDNALITGAFPLIERHSINSTDALVLRSALDLAAALRAAGDNLVLVSSDHRLLRAAQAEGLTTFDPETQSTADLDALI